MEEHAESTPSTSESIVNAEKEAFILIKNKLDGLHTNVFSLIAISTLQLGYASLINEADWITVGKDI